MVERKDASEETKKRLRVIRAEPDMTSLFHETFPCQDRLDKIARRRLRLVTTRRCGYTTTCGELTT
jgi:hypothetical protein